MNLENYLNIQEEVTLSNSKLIVVTKNQLIDDVSKLYQAGCRQFAENRVQELLKKKEQLPKDIQWHLIGSLQKNKVSQIINFITLIHSVDSLELAVEINKRAKEVDRIVDILLQIYISHDETKHGFDFELLLDSLNQKKWNELSHINIVGVMGMASFSEDKVLIASEFQFLHNCFSTLKDNYFNRSTFKEISMGMSSDYKLALQHGSTMVRIGSSIFA